MDVRIDSPNGESQTFFKPVNSSVFCGNHADAGLGEAQTAMSMPIRLANRSDRAGRLFVPQYKHSSGRVVNKSADRFWENYGVFILGEGECQMCAILKIVCMLGKSSEAHFDV